MFEFTELYNGDRPSHSRLRPDLDSKSNDRRECAEASNPTGSKVWADDKYSNEAEQVRQSRRGQILPIVTFVAIVKLTIAGMTTIS